MKRLITIPVAAGVLLTAPLALGQFYGLDDNPFVPMTGPPGFGMGAENPYGYIVPPLFPPGVAPSPTLGVLNCLDADVLFTPLPATPVVHKVSPGGPYLDALSLITMDFNRTIRLGFSVDRLTQGRGVIPGPPFLPATDVFQQAANGEQPADIFRSTTVFLPPVAFQGMPPGPFYGFQGPLPTLASLLPTQDNMLDYDQTFFGLQGIGPVAIATHDNIEQYEREIIDPNGNQTFGKWGYVTMYPDTVPLLPPPQPIVTPADIFDIAAGSAVFPVGPALPYATFLSMGLDQGFDSIDALVVYDHGAPGGPAYGGPGAEPALDYALFSLAPASQSLLTYGLSPGDIFFTNFTNGFWLYADARDLGLLPGTLVFVPPPNEGEYMLGDNLDALEVACATDIDWDGLVGFNDLVQVLSAWGGPYVKHIADTNDDKNVDFTDLVNVLSEWGPCS